MPRLDRLLLSASLVVATAAAVPTAVAADDYGTLILQDQFERSEVDDSKEQIGNGWGTNSKSRANGHKQVDLTDGVVHITMHETADHGVSFTHDIDFTNGTVALRLKLRKGDNFGINIADLQEKSVHAGHLMQVKFWPGRMELSDLKTGNMRLDLRTKRKSGQQMSPDEKKLVASKTARFENKLKPDQWHDVEMHIDGDTMVVKIDGEVVGEFSSEGIAHPTKRKLRLAVGKQAWVDNVRVWKR